MIDRAPIINNGGIIGFKKALIHIFLMDKGTGKTTRIIDSICDDELEYDGDLQSICINVRRNEKLRNRIRSVFAEGCREFGKNEIHYLVGQKIHVLYVDEWFDLSFKDRYFIIEWCLNTNTYLNAYGSKEGD